MPALGNALGLPYRKNGLGFVGALDAYAGDIAECWCPARRLLATWTGAAAVLRESGGSTEATINYDGTGYFDTATAAAHIGGGTGYFRRIFGQKGTADLEQTTAASQPVYVAAHSGFNNRVAIYLDTSLKNMLSVLDINMPYSILVIEDDDGTLFSYRTITAYTPPATFVNNLLCANRIGLSAFRDGSVCTTNTAAPTVEIFTAGTTGNHEIYRDGVDVTTGSVAVGDWETLALGIGPGGSEGAITKVAGIVVFNKKLSGAEVSAITTILAPSTL